MSLPSPQPRPPLFRPAQDVVGASSSALMSHLGARIDSFNAEQRTLRCTTADVVRRLARCNALLDDALPRPSPGQLGSAVGAEVGDNDGSCVGVRLGLSVGSSEGSKVGIAVGSDVGRLEGCRLGVIDGKLEGSIVGNNVGTKDGSKEGCADG